MFQKHFLVSALVLAGTLLIVGKASRRPPQISPSPAPPMFKANRPNPDRSTGTDFPPSQPLAGKACQRL